MSDDEIRARRAARRAAERAGNRTTPETEYVIVRRKSLGETVSVSIVHRDGFDFTNFRFAGMSLASQNVPVEEWTHIDLL